MKDKPASLRRLLAAVLLATVALPAVPQAPDRFTVEIVVFRNGGQVGRLPGDAPLPPASTDVDFELVGSRKLSVSANRLRNTGNYRVLAHTAWTQGPAGFNSGRGVSSARLGLEAAGIRGKVMLERGRYLHLGIDLVIDDGGARYHIAQTRQVKPDEIQYYDHPAVGVLAIVTPAE